MDSPTDPAGEQASPAGGQGRPAGRQTSPERALVPATVGRVRELMERRYDPRTAESWDRVGLVCGDPAARAGRVLLAVDPVAAVVQEAIEREVDMLITHHPLLLRGVHSVATDTAKGRLIHRLIRADIALLAAHTNADHAVPGVSDAIAAALGLRGVVALEPLAEEPADREALGRDKYLVMVPVAAAGQVIDAMADAGAGQIGNYDRAAFWATGTGTFRPLAGANPTIGTVGDVAEVPEAQVHMIAPRGLRSRVVSALRAAHPYEEPAFDIIGLAAEPSGRGAGRVGELPQPITLTRFAELVAHALPATSHGVRVAGAGDRLIRRVALCGGAGDSLLGVAAASGADVYLTSDLRHHPASESLEAGGPALVDVAHWAAEWMWLPAARDLLVADAAAAGLALSVEVSTIVTDPWTAHIAAPAN